MAAVTSASLWLTLLSVVLFVSGGQINITVGPGQNVSLPCKALNNEPVSVVHWRRTDLKTEEDLLLYRGGKFDTYKNRVDLQDRQMKDGNVSLILKNVTTDDSGTYECYVQTKTNKMTITIRLDVDPGHKEDRGDKEGGDKEGQDEEGGDKDGLSRGHIGLITGSIVGVTVLVAVGFLIFRKRRHHLKPNAYDRPDPDAKQV